jgi:hypothetical protein
MTVIIVLVVLALLLFIGWLWMRRVPTAEPPVVTVLAAKTLSAFGRDYEIQVLESEHGGSSYRTMQLAGDGMALSFHTSTGPFQPTVNGPVVSFGGHEIEVLASPNQYRIDQNAHDLPVSGLYVFSDGEFIRRVR